MKGISPSTLAMAAMPAVAAAACISSGDQNTIQNALQSGGAGAVVQLCAGATIQVTGQISFTAANQEISTQGYPTDSSRATIQIKPGNSASTIIAGKGFNGIKIRNIQLDGNRPNAGYQPDGGANIEIGGLSSGQVIEYVNSRNPRGWSCMHIIGSGNGNPPCTNATVQNNDIGPCGQSGTNSAGQGLWADGVSLDCTNSLVQNNHITGSTDGGVVIFGSPGSTIRNNTIQSSDQYLGFGAINMVDPEYNGSYAGVTVTGNTIIGGAKMFNLGIGIGAHVWSSNDPNPLSGPATITNNKFSGHISFPIAVNGWTGGLTISGNDVSGITSPKSSFSDATHCSAAVQSLFNSNANLIYYPAGLTGSQSLQSGFSAASANVTDFLCSTTPLPNSITFQKNGLSISTDGPPFADMHGAYAQYQGDNNVVFLVNGKAVWAAGHTVSGGCGSPSQCKFTFDSTGNLQTTYQGGVQWSSNTGGRGNTLVALNASPWLQVKDSSNNVIWDTTKL